MLFRSPRDTAIHAFEEEGKTIVEGNRELSTSARFFDLARTISNFAGQPNVA